MTEVTYHGKTGNYTLYKGCETERQCEIRRNAAAATCDRGSSAAYCVYCCNSPKCNLEVEFLTFKGRKKRSTDRESGKITSEWNGTVPMCIGIFFEKYLARMFWNKKLRYCHDHDGVQHIFDINKNL